MVQYSNAVDKNQEKWLFYTFLAKKKLKSLEIQKLFVPLHPLLRDSPLRVNKEEFFERLT